MEADTIQNQRLLIAPLNALKWHLYFLTYFYVICIDSFLGRYIEGGTNWMAVKKRKAFCSDWISRSCGLRSHDLDTIQTQDTNLKTLDWTWENHKFKFNTIALWLYLDFILLTWDDLIFWMSNVECEAIFLTTVYFESIWPTLFGLAGLDLDLTWDTNMFCRVISAEENRA